MAVHSQTSSTSIGADPFETVPVRCLFWFDFRLSCMNRFRTSIARVAQVFRNMHRFAWIALAQAPAKCAGRPRAQCKFQTARGVITVRRAWWACTDPQVGTLCSGAGAIGSSPMCARKCQMANNCFPSHIVPHASACTLTTVRWNFRPSHVQFLRRLPRWSGRSWHC